MTVAGMVALKMVALQRLSIGAESGYQFAPCGPYNPLPAGSGTWTIHHLPEPSVVSQPPRY